MPDDYNPWVTGTGLYDDVDICIEDAVFEWDGEYDRLLLKLDITTDDDENPTDTLSLGCGKGWEVAEKGKSARREDGKSKPFNAQSGIGLFIDAMVEAGALDELTRTDDKGNLLRGNPTQAKAWVGLKFHAEWKIIKSNDPEYKDRNPLLPTKFLGVKGKGGSGSGGNASTPDSATSTTPTPDSTPTPDAAEGLSGKLKVQLLKLAKEHTDHDDFLVAAYEMDGVDGNPAAEEAIAEPGSGIWAQVHGS